MMSSELEKLVGKATTDKAFRKELLADPEGAVKNAGFNLTDEELEKVKAAASSTSAEDDICPESPSLFPEPLRSMAQTLIPFSTSQGPVSNNQPPWL